MTRIFLVTGATGKQGGAVVRQLLKKGWNVRALTRSPEKDEALVLRSIGVEVVQGDLSDAVSLRNALHDIYGVFSVQNSWEHGVENEIVQGKLLADEAKHAGVRHFIYSSVGSAHRNTGIPHFESKWIIEQYIRSIKLRSTILRPVFFMENLFMPDTLQAIMGGTLSLGTDAAVPLQMITVDDIGAFVQMAFEKPGEYLGKAIDIAGDMLTGPQMAAILGRVLEKDMEYRQIPIEQIRSFSADYGLMVDWFNTRGYDVDIPALRKVRPELMNFEQWVQDHKTVLTEEHAHA